MPVDAGNRRGKVVEPLMVNMMRKKLRVMIQHDDLAFDADARRRDRFAA